MLDQVFEAAKVLLPTPEDEQCKTDGVSQKQLDQLASMDAARNMIAELADTFNWDTESEIVEDFLFKICRRHAAGA